MLQIAFKEWAVVCRAIGEGRQRIILRKGGISEVGGTFRPEHDRFWLYPTYFHEPQFKGIKPECTPLLEAAEAARPPAGKLHLTHWAEVNGVEYVTDLDVLLKLADRHVLSEETIRQRFAYRTPGLYVLRVTAYMPVAPYVVAEKPEYAGCKTWVTLDAPLDTAGSTVAWNWESRR